jgi:hypothetical protein
MRKRVTAIALSAAFCWVAMTPKVRANPAIAAPAAVACVTSVVCALTVVMIGGIAYYAITYDDSEPTYLPIQENVGITANNLKDAFSKCEAEANSRGLIMVNVVRHAKVGWYICVLTDSL